MRPPTVTAMAVPGTDATTGRWRRAGVALRSGRPLRARRAGRAAARAADVTPPTPTPDPTAAAFFDVDNTVLRGASVFYFARTLYRHRFFTARDLRRFAWQQARFVAVGESLAHLADVRERALSLVAGHRVSELREVGEEAWTVMATKVWPGSRALADQHLRAGQRVWLVTATPVEVADVIAHRLGLTGALGTVAEHVDGTYTGRLVGEPLHGPAKAEAVRALAEREGLDLARCAAYSDSVNDLPLLGLVGRPVVVNPDRRLRAHAREHGWQVVDFRRGRRAAAVGVPVVTGGGAVAGAVMLARRMLR
jgi:HAD superfamily hydrolase (TIGR01490 family)